MSINSFDIEESFFNVSSFIVYNNIYHNLNNWHIKLDNWENKAGQIELNILVPYAEMDIEITETNNDPNFFNKNTARLKININTNNQSYVFQKTIKCTFTESVKYLILDTMFIYPHNWYYFYNHEYLRDKICNSFDYVHSFVQAYKNLFNNNIPFIFIDNITETIDNYTFDIVIKEYLNIFYLTTNIDNNMIFMNLLLDKKYKDKEKNIKYKKISVQIPRLVKNKKYQFKFVTGSFSCD